MRSKPELFMKANFRCSNLAVLFFACRPKFLTASAAPVLVGSTLGYATTGSFNPTLFILALLAILAIHAGANLANDYFDHLSGNDPANKNPTPFSGGSRFIQQGLLSPKTVLLESLIFLTIGSAIGLVIVLLTKSIFILIIGLIGLLGGFFYTAPPFRLGYRSVGEIVIALLFGLLPVYASCYLQTFCLPSSVFCLLPSDFCLLSSAFCLLPACIVGILIFLVILINEFPDLAADAAVNKKTLVVRYGIAAAVRIYRLALISSYILAIIAMLTHSRFFFAGLFYLLTLPIAAAAIKSANKNDLAKPAQYRASQITVLLHTTASLALTAGFIIPW